VRAVPRLCEFYPGICLTTEEKARKNLSQVKKNLSQIRKKLTTEEKARKTLSFERISEQTATFAGYIIKWSVFITVVESVYSAVRTDSLYKADYF